MTMHSNNCDFKSAFASGATWSECVSHIIDDLNALPPQINSDHDDSYNFGFIYISDLISDHFDDALKLLSEKLHITNWTGCVAKRIIGKNASSLDEPSISVMIGKLPKDSFHLLGEESTENNSNLQNWLNQENTGIGVIHCSPLSEDLRNNLKKLHNVSNAPTIGGITTARYNYFNVQKNMRLDYDCGGVLFSNQVPTKTCLSQGARAFSERFEITKADYCTILEINNEPVTNVLADLLRQNHKEKNPHIAGHYDYKALLADLTRYTPDEFKALVDTQIFVGITPKGSDLGEYYIRLINNIDLEEKSITINEVINEGDTLFLTQSTEESIVSDLSDRLENMRKEIIAKTGRFEPKAALYISCLGRATHMPQDVREKELSTLQRITGNIPLTGYYAGGEILNGHIHNFSSILLLFL